MNLVGKVLTYSGAYFDLLHPEASPIHLADIAHSLAHQCRFNGHTRTFYSVAQHSVFVSHLVPDAHAREALLHDAAEAYTGDITIPVKDLLPGLRLIEHRIDLAIRNTYGLPLRCSADVKLADRIALATERRDLLSEHDRPWPLIEGLGDLPEDVITPLPPAIARDQFMARARELGLLNRKEKTA